MHEQSETVQLENGKWVNIYGPGTPHAGQRLPGTSEYDTVEEAVKAAKQRSDEHVKPGVIRQKMEVMQTGAAAAGPAGKTAPGAGRVAVEKAYDDAARRGGGKGAE